MKRTNLWRVALIALSLWLMLIAIPFSGPPLLQAGAQDGVTLDLVAQLGGTTYAVHVVGDYAYVGEGPRLVILNISDPANPAEVGRTDVLPGVVHGVHVVGDYAYVAAINEGLRVISVADKANPTEVGFFDTPGYAMDVHVVGDYVYVADHWAGLRVISVSDKANPTEVGSFGTSGWAWGVHVVGDYAYVADNALVAVSENGLRVISVADKANPTEVGFLDTPGGASGVHVVGDYAYVADGGEGLRVISVADKANPIEVGFFDTAGGAGGVHVVGDYAYVADYGDGLRVISVADKANPTEVGFLDTPGWAEGVHVVGDYAYVADSGDGLRVISVSDKANPTEVGFFDTAGGASGVYVVGDYAYVAAGRDGFRIISVADKANPTEIGFLDMPGYAGGVHVVGDYAYVADRWEGLRVISVADKANPTEVGFFDTAGYAEGVHVLGDYAYIAQSEDGLRVISVADKANPTEIGFLETPGYAWGVHVVGDYAYVADGGEGLRVISVVDKANPTEVGFLETPSYAWGVYVVGDYAYVTDADTGLRVISVADKANPTEVGFFDTAGGASGVHVVGDHAYVVESGEGLRVISVADKANPTEVGFFDTAGGASGVHVVGDHAYVADNSGGLVILRFMEEILAVAGYNGQPGYELSGDPLPESAHVYLPIAARNGLNTTLFIQNTVGDAATIVVTFYDMDGVIVHTVGDTILPHGSLTYELATIPELPGGFEGSAVVASDQPILAVANVRALGADSLLSYNGILTGATEVVLPIIVRDYYDWNTDFWVQNVGSTSANVTMTYYPSTGNSHVATDSIPPGASHIYRQEEIPELGTSFIGWVLVEADEPVAVVVEQWLSTDANASAYNGIAIADADVSILSPRQQKEVDGWSSGVSIMNLGEVDATITPYWYAGDGSEVWTETNTVPPGAFITYYLPAYGMPDGFDGALVGSADQPVVALVNWLGPFLVGDGFAANLGIGQGQLQREMYLPRVAHVVAEGVSTQFSIQNAAEVTATVTISYYHQSGVATAILADAIPAHGVSRYTTVDVGALGDDWEGSVAISSTQPVAVEAMQFLRTSMPVTISDVRTTNVRDTSFTVSWLTNVDADGEVHYGTDPANLNQTAYDDRGAGTSDDTHYVTLTDLTPNTNYYFDVVSGSTTDDNGGAHYSVTTGPTLGLPASDTIYGQVFKEDGTTLAEGTIVYITLRDADGSGSPDEAAPLSALVDDTGYWYANLGNARTADLSGYFDYSASGDWVLLKAQGAADGVGCLAVNTAEDTPAAPIVLNVSRCTWPIDIQVGWNHISLPLVPLTPYTAEGVCDEINSQGGDVAEIDRWYASGWDGHICGLPFNDFAIELGSDYFIRSNAVSTWTIEGYEVTTGVPPDLQIGWNSIGIPHTDAYTAESLCDEINDQCGDGTAVEVDRWYASGWDGHICGLPFNNFAIEIGKGYFVKASGACTVMPSLAATSSTAASPLAMPKSTEVPWAASPVELSLFHRAREAKAAIAEVKVTNLRDTSFTVAWSTDVMATGWVNYGTSPALGQTAYDDRGADTVGQSHHVTLHSLSPQTTYYFEVVSGATVDDHKRRCYQVTTGPTLELPASHSIYGRVFESDGVTPAEGAIVYITLRDADGAGSPGESGMMSALMDGDGWWHANLGNTRLTDGSGYFTYSAAGDAVVLMVQGADGGFVSRTVDTSGLGSAAQLTLVRQQRPYLPLVIKE